VNRHQEAMLVQAIEYARRGWHVLPCNYNKQPSTPNGFYDATTDEDQITRWWEANPKAQIGIRTGEESGFWVVDIDCKNGKNGLESLKKHFGQMFNLEDGLFQKTPTGGFHLCFKYDENEPVGCQSGLLDGVDIRGNGGYIMAAPSSLHVNDNWQQYVWKDLKKDPTEAPDWAKQLVRSTSSVSTSQLLVGELLQQGVAEGVRDESLFRLACLLEREGIDIDTAKSTITIVAECCTPPFSATEATKKVERAYTQYATPKEIHGDRLARISKAIGTETT